MKLLVALVLLAVMISLGSALFSMTSSEDRSVRMLRALTIRVALSVGLVVVLVVSWKLGFIEPHSGG